MKLYLAPEIVERFPGYTMYTVVAKGIDNTAVPAELVELLAQATESARAKVGDAPKSHPRIASWRAAFESFGADPDEYPPSVQHLAEMAQAGEHISQQTPIVALLNLISLKYLVPCGADDLALVSGDFGVRISQGNEIYVPIGTSEIESPDAGEVIYGDARKVMARRWIWRQGEHTKVTEATRDVTINVDILPPASREQGEAAVAELVELVQRFCGGEVGYNVLSADQIQANVEPSGAPQRSTNVYDVLEERGYLRRTSDRDGVRQLLSQPTTIYQGFDPTGESLHIGHLLSLMIFRYLQRAGHRMLFLVGGGTGQVGDPTGKTKSRSVLTEEVIAHNMACIREQVQAMGLADFENDAPGRPKATMVNNADWLNMSFFDFLREVALYFSVNRMIKMETFMARLEAQEHLSLFEFMYPTMQGYDFYHLFVNEGCRLQLGGDDQWTNILSGMTLIKSKLGEDAYAMTVGLLLDSTGGKMGKTSAGEAIWLDASRTSPFQFYQYWVSQPDTDLHRSFRVFTFLPLAEIDAIVAGDPRQAQQRLAFEVTKVVHGEEAAKGAQNDARKAFGAAAGLPDDIPTVGLSAADLEAGLLLIDAVVLAEDVSSKGAARRLIQQGGVRINDVKADDLNRSITLQDADEVDGQRVVFIRYGKRKFIKIVVE
jgi:tyrosyl-tRNA synthetase